MSSKKQRNTGGSILDLPPEVRKALFVGRDPSEPVPELSRDSGPQQPWSPQDAKMLHLEAAQNLARLKAEEEQRRRMLEQSQEQALADKEAQIKAEGYESYPRQPVQKRQFPALQKALTPEIPQQMGAIELPSDPEAEAAMIEEIRRRSGR